MTGTELTRKVSVEGMPVGYIRLATGCLTMLMHLELIPRSKMLDGEAVAVHCDTGTQFCIWQYCCKL